MAAPALSIASQHSARLADPALREALLKYARRRLPPPEVDDLVQNTLTCALLSASAPGDEREFQRWVHGIARHKVADLYRRRGQSPVLEADLHDKVCSNDPGPATGELEQWIERELPKTDGAHATLHWLLRESDGESLDEIAREEEVPAPRVRQRVSRLRRHLHSRWLALGAAGLALLLCTGVALHLWRSQKSADIAKDTLPRAQPTVSVSAPPPSAPAGDTPPITKQPPKAQVNSVQPEPVTKAVPKQKQKQKPLPHKKLSPKARLSPINEPTSKAAKQQVAPNSSPLSQSNIKQNVDSNAFPAQQN